MGENKIRLNYLDMSKGFGILLVIAGHIYMKEIVLQKYGFILSICHCFL